MRALSCLRYQTAHFFMAFLCAVLAFNMWGCAPAVKGSLPQASALKPQRIKPAPDASVKAPKHVSSALYFRPGVQWKPSYDVRDVDLKNQKAALPALKVGSDISTTGGKVKLRKVMKGLADLKDMNLSWASDVDQDALVDVNIKATDNFWTAIDNLLRQLDYFFEFKNNTIIVRYKDTKRFYLPMPFLTSSYNSDVGGDLLGNDETTAGLMKGTVSVKNSDDKIDLWSNIRTNLDKILQLATTRVSTRASTPPGELSQEDMARINDMCLQQFASRPAQQALCRERERAKLLKSYAEKKAKETTPGKQKTAVAAGEAKGSRKGFFYTIDKPLGIVTVTAPRSLLSQVGAYLNAVKKELSRQVIIEAKVIEVTLTDGYKRGIDWSSLLEDSNLSGSISFGSLGKVWPRQGVKLISSVNLTSKDFNLLLNALNRYGSVRVLSNPKISLLNGHPAMITVGESIRYVDSVTSAIDSSTGIITYTVETKSLLSGLGLGVLANITSDDEVVLQLTPVTSKLQEPMAEATFGSSGSESKVGLPRISLREMSTMARLKSGQLLIIGGLIDDQTTKEKTKVPVLGDLPFVGKAFQYESKSSEKKELIILLRPQVVNI